MSDVICVHARMKTTYAHCTTTNKYRTIFTELISKDANMFDLESQWYRLFNRI